MAFKLRNAGTSRPRARSAYERFIESEGVPVVGGFGIDSVCELPMAPWARLGGAGAYLDFFGSDGVIGLYAGKIAPGASLQPERHLYEKLIFILEGEGIAEFQQRDHVPQTLLWRSGSLFSPPLNTLHRLINQADRPAFYLAVTTAPLALDHYRDELFVFHCDHVFRDRYDGEVNYFNASDAMSQTQGRRSLQQGNFIVDVGAVGGNPQDRRGRIRITRFEVAKNSLIGQLVEWPVGRYRKAHCRSGGVALVILRSSGYSLMWPSHLGTMPYKAGSADQVVRVDWSPGSIFSPPPNWFHQHFNTGNEPAQTLAFYCGSMHYPMTRHIDGANAARPALPQQSSALIKFEAGDPSIRRMYEVELAKKGVAPDMKTIGAVPND